MTANISSGTEAPDRQRCSWAGSHPLMAAYHDTEWGVPLYDDRKLYEFLVLEGAQAGLSWQTILLRREGYRSAFAGFDPMQVSTFAEADVARLMADSGIIRNQAKIRSAIANARALLNVQAEFGSFSDYMWRFVDGAPVVNCYRDWQEIPAETDQSRAMSKDLRKRGFTFVGPTICYAHMQAVGMVNDHTVDCFRHAECRALAARP